MVANNPRELKTLRGRSEKWRNFLTSLIINLFLLVIIRGVLVRIRYDYLIYIYIYMCVCVCVLNRIINFNFILFNIFIFNQRINYIN